MYHKMRSEGRKDLFGFSLPPSKTEKQILFHKLMPLYLLHKPVAKRIRWIELSSTKGKSICLHTLSTFSLACPVSEQGKGSKKSSSSISHSETFFIWLSRQCKQSSTLERMFLTFITHFWASINLDATSRT